MSCQLRQFSLLVVEQKSVQTIAVACSCWYGSGFEILVDEDDERAIQCVQIEIKHNFKTFYLLHLVTPSGAEVVYLPFFFFTFFTH